MTILNHGRMILLLTAGLSTLALGVGSDDRPLGQADGVAHLFRDGGLLKARGQSTGEKPFEYVSPEVARLEMLYGVWRVTERHFNAKGKTVAIVKGAEKIEWLLDRRAIRRDYSTTTDTMVFRAFGILTWNDAEKKYNGVWFDNVSTVGPATVEGVWDEKNRTMTFNVQSLAQNGSTMRHKVVERFEDGEKRVATTYLVDGKKMIKRMEVQYKRARSCPGRIRTIFDD